MTMKVDASRTAKEKLHLHKTIITIPTSLPRDLRNYSFFGGKPSHARVLPATMASTNVFIAASPATVRMANQHRAAAKRTGITRNTRMIASTGVCTSMNKFFLQVNPDEAAAVSAGLPRPKTRLTDDGSQHTSQHAGTITIGSVW